MVDLDINRPFYKVEIFEPESSQAKLVFSPNIFRDIEQPDTNEQIASDIYISHITVNTKLEGAINTADIEIRHGIGAILNMDLGHTVKVYFGFYDHDKSLGPDYSLVYTGKISQIKNGFEKSIIHCKSSLTKIAKKVTELTFSRMMGITLSTT